MQAYIIKKQKKTGGRENSLKTVVGRARATGYYREDVSPITPSRQVNTKVLFDRIWLRCC